MTTAPAAAQGSNPRTRRELLSEIALPATAASDESFWFEVQQAFTPERTIVNLNNGGVSPSLRVVQEAMKRHLDFANTATAYTLPAEIDRFRAAMEEVLAKGLPA